MIVSILAFLVVFTFIVLVHEFGHFLAARSPALKSTSFQ